MWTQRPSGARATAPPTWCPRPSRTSRTAPRKRRSSCATCRYPSSPPIRFNKYSITISMRSQ
eukprot:9175524-Pyramimonas_sp.AAC.3